jgi:hypothetical protein
VLNCFDLFYYSAMLIEKFLLGAFLHVWRIYAAGQGKTAQHAHPRRECAPLQVASCCSAVC